MACPFFVPMEKLENGPWLHAGRLPLGCGWSGHCAAPGHEGELPSLDELRDFCNLGYAEGCGRLPRERTWDSVRFAARTASADAETGSRVRILVRYICERGHYPVEHGVLEFDCASACWNKLHGDDRVQRLAECFVAAYLDRKKSQVVTQAAAS